MYPVKFSHSDNITRLVKQALGKQVCSLFTLVCHTFSFFLNGYDFGLEKERDTNSPCGGDA